MIHTVKHHIRPAVSKETPSLPRDLRKQSEMRMADKEKHCNRDVSPGGFTMFHSQYGNNVPRKEPPRPVHWAATIYVSKGEKNVPQMRQEKSECSYILAKLLHDLQDWDAALAAAQALYLMWVQMDVMVSAAVYSTVTVARRIWGRLNPQFCFDL